MILFIDTHDSLITIGLKVGDKLYESTKESEYSHSIFVLPMIKDIINKSGKTVKDLEKIVVVNGPGSFTGIRIGLSIAKTLAYALNISINTISSLTAYLVSNDTNGNKMCVIEDNKGYYISIFDKDNNKVIDEEYVSEIKYDTPRVNEKLDINKIIEYVSNFKSEEVHHIKANYVKKIEVEK